MDVARTIQELRTRLHPLRAGNTIGFVPTMGALHEGHLSLVRTARQECEVVVLSIFVNPLQFGPTEDLGRYPRPEARDLDVAGQAGVDIAFVPTVDEMYPQGRSTVVHVAGLDGVLEGVARPGHFDGVATVVTKLLNIVQPDRAYFGQKDAQQVAVVRRLIRDLSIPTKLRVCPTVRTDDGLALSSRNAYLTSEDRTTALVLWRALQAGREAFAGSGPAAAERAMKEVFSTEPSVVVDYAACVDPVDFGPARGSEALLVVAARVGSTRLIDNLLVGTSA